MPDTTEITYYVLADRAVAYLLVRVRWPDVAQAISAANPDWLDDMGLFDLPYDPTALEVSFDQAASIAAGWGRQLHAEPAEDVPSYIRRMPANWSDLSPSERGAWGLESVGRRRAPARRFRRLAVVTGKLGRDADERRTGARVPVAGRAYIRFEHITVSAGLVDLSERGVGCVLPETSSLIAPGAPLGGPLLLEVESDTSRICLDVSSRISWQRSTEDGTHFGVSFTELSKDEKRGVQRALAVPARNRTKVTA
jgi:PilZ domain